MGRFEPPLGFTQASFWTWLDHPGSGLHSVTSRPSQTRFRFGFGSCLNLPRLATRRLILQQARGQTFNRPPTACRLTVSCSFSLPFWGSFHLSLAVLCSIGHPVVFSLTRWSSLIHTGFHVPRATRDSVSLASAFNYRTFTFSGAAFNSFV